MNTSPADTLPQAAVHLNSKRAPAPSRPASRSAQPLLSLIMPTSGRAPLVELTLASLGAQTLRDWELIVPDDSADPLQRAAIEKLVEEFAARTGIPVTYIHTAPRLLQSRNTNQGLARVQGRRVRILHSDDLLAPGALESEMAMLDRFSSVAEALFVDPIPFEGRFEPNPKPRPALLSPRYLVRTMLHSATALPSCMVFDRALLERIGGLDPDYLFLCDWKFFYRLLLDQIRRGKSIVRVSPSWVGWRNHGDTVTSRLWDVHFREHLSLMGEIKASDDLEALVGLTAPEIADFHRCAHLYRHRRLRDDGAKNARAATPRTLDIVEELLTLDPLTAETEKILAVEKPADAESAALGMAVLLCAEARALHRQGLVDEAIAFAHKAVLAAKPSTMVFETLSMCLGSRIEREAREGNPVAVGASRNERANALNNLGNCLVGEKAIDRALAAYRECLELNLAHPEARNSLGYALMEKGDYAQAIVELERFTAATPAHFSARCNLGRASAETGNFSACAAHYRAALDLDGASADATWGLAEALRRLGRLDDARSAYESVLLLRPGHSQAAAQLKALREALAWKGSPILAVYEGIIRAAEAEGAPLQYEFAPEYCGSLKMRNHFQPWSIKCTEFGALQDVIRRKGLRRGFDLATAFGISSLAAGQALKANGGKLVTMDAYIEEQHDSSLAYRTLREVKSSEADGYRSVQWLIRHFGLEETIFPTVGWSPDDTAARIQSVFPGRAELDYVFIDAGHWDEALVADVGAIRPFLADQFAVFIHDTDCFGPAAIDTVETVLGSKLRLLPECAFPFGWNLGVITSFADL